MNAPDRQSSEVTTAAAVVACLLIAVVGIAALALSHLFQLF